jgi:hypothetical protein
MEKKKRKTKICVCSSEDHLLTIKYGRLNISKNNILRKPQKDSIKKVINVTESGNSCSPFPY